MLSTIGTFGSRFLERLAPKVAAKAACSGYNSYCGCYYSGSLRYHHAQSCVSCPGRPVSCSSCQRTSRC